jgi:NitT/TauT family transport system substrate-binding protein
MSAPPHDAPFPVILAMGFIPTVLFAPFYVPAKKGYYAAEGLEVEFRYGIEEEILDALNRGEIHFTVSKCNNVLKARDRGGRVKLVWNWYVRDFACILSAKEKGILKPDDLIGKTIGVPSFEGSEYFAYRAILHVTGIDESQIPQKLVGWRQVEAIEAGEVDAILGSWIHEGVMLEHKGYTLNIIHVLDYMQMVGAGLVTNERMIAEQPDIIRRIVRAINRGQQDTFTHPDEAFELSLDFVPDARGERAEMQRAALHAMLRLYGPQDTGPTSAEGWKNTYQFMHAAGMLKAEFNPDDAFTNEFVQ